MVAVVSCNLRSAPDSDRRETVKPTSMRQAQLRTWWVAAELDSGPNGAGASHHAQTT